MSLGIHDCRISYAGQSTEKIRSIEIDFGDDHRLAVRTQDGAAKVSLATDHQQLTLDADGPRCDFERALNLLRLHFRPRE